MEIIAKSFQQFLIVHVLIVCDLAPQSSHVQGLVDLELKVVASPLNEVCVGRDEE